MAIYLYSGLFILGMIFLLISIWQYQKTKNLVTSGIKTTGEVIQMITVSDSDGDTYKPVFQYKDRHGNSNKLISDVSSSPPSYQVGDKVTIVYNPTDTQEAKVVSYWGLYIGTIIWLSLAAPLLIIGGGYLWYIRG